MQLDTTYENLDATALAEKVRAGEVSPRELVEEAIRRCERTNGTLNAVITEMFEHARAAAEHVPLTGPFAGVPFLMKDFGAEVAGTRFTEGSAFLSAYIPDEDSELYRRFCEAGLITFGKTNLPEFAMGTTTEPQLFGPSRNPWDPDRTTGGSSGGAGAAVAARVVPMAHGNDVGGSIRIPASCCGLVGLKPSRGRVTLAPHYGDVLGGAFQELALTRSVRDTAALLDAVTASTPGEPYVAAPPPRPYAEEVLRDPAPMRIGFSTTTPLGDPVDDECLDAVIATATLCKSLGHDVEEAAPDFNAERLWTQYTTMLAALMAWAIADWARRTGQAATEDRFEPFVWAFSDRGRNLDAAEYLMAVQDVQREVRQLSRFYETRDVWLTPTLGQPPVPLGTLRYEGDPFALRRRMARFSPYTYIANASGQPAISLPLHWSGEGLPIGLHFTARLGEESRLLALAAQLERAAPWGDKKPAIG